jgi:hypothetical protein
MFKRAVREGRSLREPEEIQTALRVGRSPIELILANGKAPQVLPTFENRIRYVEGLSDARTQPEVLFNIRYPSRSCTASGSQENMPSRYAWPFGVVATSSILSYALIVVPLPADAETCMVNAALGAWDAIS